MSVRRAIVMIDPASVNVAEFCRQHHISRRFFYSLRSRYAKDGEAALEPGSRAPNHVANKTGIDVEEAIVAARKELDGLGYDAGAESIHDHLEGMDGLPSPATIWRILRARGLITPEPAKAPKRSARSFTAERANECWQLDDTTWQLADGSEVKILNVVDDHSRLLIASTVTTSCTGAFALATLAAVAPVLGWPARFLSDNAGAFRHVLANALAALGIGAGHSRPYHPQTNGKVERFHQTLKRWLAKQPPARSMDDLQAQLDLFRHHYNHRRRHRSLDRRVPAEVWTNAPKAGPAPHPLGTPTRVHDSTVGATGAFTAGDYAINVGTAHAGSHTLTVITGTACHVFIDGALTRAFTLDPAHRVQPLNPRLP